jgi:Cu-processing system permease protein
MSNKRSVAESRLHPGAGACVGGCVPYLIMQTMQFIVDLKSAVRIALRSGFGSIGFGLIVVTCVVVGVAGLFSARQPETVALDVGISFVRIALAIVAIVLVQDLVVREFDRRYYLYSLTYPHSRYQFLGGRYVAAAGLIAGLLVFAGVVLAAGATFVGAIYAQGTATRLGWPFIATMAFVFLDLLVVLAFSTFLAIVAATPGFVLIGAAGFVLIARSYGAIVELLNANGYVVARFANPQTYRDTLSLLDYCLPDLGGLDVREIALYGRMDMLPADWHWRALAALAYAAFLLALSGLALSRREFR